MIEGEMQGMDELVATDDEVAEFSLFDEMNPRSLVNIVPEELKLALKSIPRDLVFMDEKALKKKVKPSDTLNYVRLNFWLEYNRAQQRRGNMSVAAIIRGVGHKEWLYNVVFKDPVKMAWVVTPPTDYAIIQQDILHAGLDKLRQALRVPLYIETRVETTDPEGNTKVKTTRKPNVAVIKEIREITRWLSDRVQGTMVQKLAVRAHSTGEVAHHQLGAGGAPQVFMPDSLDKMNRSLEAIDKKLAIAERASITIDGEATVIDVD